MPTRIASIAPVMIQNALVALAGDADVHAPQARDEGERQHDHADAVSARRISFTRCEITDSFVSSSASTTSL